MNYFFESNHELEASIDNFFSLLAEINESKYNGELSLMLLGSLSRGEATWGICEGKLIIFSDIEFFTIVPSGFNRQKEFTEDIHFCSEKCFSEYGSDLFRIDNTFLDITGIPFMERKILTYDAKNIGKMIFGKDCISIMPNITFDNINLEDIWDVLVHRMFYVAYYGLNYKLKGDEEGYRYTLAKNSLDLMTVMLAKHKLLESGFKKKLDVLRQLGTDSTICDYLNYCLCLKLGIFTNKTYTTHEMSCEFLKIEKELIESFKIPFRNRLINRKVLIRRRLGIIKRMVCMKYFSRGRICFLKNIINKFENNQPLDENDLKSSYILNGYPQISNW